MTTVTTTTITEDAPSVAPLDEAPASSYHITADSPPAHITNAQVIQCIKDDAAMAGLDVTDRQARHVLGMFSKAAQIIRQSPDAIYLLTRKDMKLAHRVIDVIVPDDVDVAEPESAHEALNLRFLQDGELSFVHTVGEARGQDQFYCALAIFINTTRTPVA